jgi:hypothetical protein
MISVFAGCAFCPNIALAQSAGAAGSTEGVEEITVTAEKRSDIVTNVPMALSVISGDQLLRKLQWQASRRTAQWRDLLQSKGSPGRHPPVAPSLQRRQTPLIAAISATGAANFYTAVVPSRLRTY